MPLGNILQINEIIGETTTHLTVPDIDRILQWGAMADEDKFNRDPADSVLLDKLAAIRATL